MAPRSRRSASPRLEWNHLVGVVVGADGKISQVSLSATSGFALLDEQALRMVERVSIWWTPQRLRKGAAALRPPANPPQGLCAICPSVPVKPSWPKRRSSLEVISLYHPG
jgi:hypothetical protein